MRPQARQGGSGRSYDCSSSEDSKTGAQERSTPATDGRSMKRSASFKSFLQTKDVPKSPTKSSKKDTRQLEEKALKKSKSSTSLSALFSRPRSSKGSKADEVRLQDDKENERPSDFTPLAQPPPIWAQFATTAVLDSPSTKQVPLNDCGSGKEDLKKNTARLGSPSKGRTARDRDLPAPSEISRRKSRPKSESLEFDIYSESQSKIFSGIRRSARHRGGARDSNEETLIHQNNLETEQNPSHCEKGGNVVVAKRGSRVLEAAAFFNQKSQQSPKESAARPSSARLDPVAVEEAFEFLLDTRNVPLATRDKMRNLDTNIKADFIKQDKANPGSASSAEGLAERTSRPQSRKQAGSSASDELDEGKENVTPKKLRPRSLTFTFSKGDQSPSKRQESSSHQRAKSGELTPTASSKPSSPAVNSYGLSLFAKSDKFALPEQVIGYLRKVQPPQAVEVGKIQKLRQLLRNETVGWVDDFTAQGGMMEIVQLLYRTMAVEWRYV